MGIFPMIIEETSLPKGDDAKLLSKLASKHSAHPRFIARTRARDCFGVQHYAGEVVYDVRGFVEKDRDELHHDVVQLMRTSTVAMVKRCFADDSGGAKTAGVGAPARKKRAPTISETFLRQLNDLMTTLRATQLC